MSARQTLVALGVLVVASLASNGQVCGTELFKIHPDDAAAGDLFGSSIAIQGTAGVIGSPHDDGSRGAAYIFLMGDGSQFTKLVADAAVPGAVFGSSVASTGFNIVVGAPRDLNDSHTASTGAAYLFGSLGGAQLHRFVGSDSVALDLFGDSVAISGNIVAVGAPGNSSGGLTDNGAVYLFDRVSGMEIGKLVSFNGLTEDLMGSSVAMDGSTLVAGAPQPMISPSNSGAVFVFDISTMNQTMTLFNDGSVGDEFGAAVAIEGDYILVGAPGDGQSGLNAGAVYVFDRTSGVLLYKYVSLDSNPANEHLGSSIAINGTRAVFGAPRTGSQGLSVLVDLVSGTKIADLRASDELAGEFQRFGVAVGMSDSGILVGASDSNELGVQSGAAYRFDANPMSCPVDLNNDCALNFFDVSAFLSAFGDGDLVADFNGDGTLNFFDVSAYLSAFGDGCP